VHTFSASNILFWFFSDFRPVSLEMFPNCSFSLYDLVGTSTLWCNTEMFGHSHFFGSLNLNPKPFRIAQFGKEFGAYIFLGGFSFWFLSTFCRIWFQNVPRLFILRYDLVGTSTSWCSTEISEHFHYWESRSAHPMETVKYGLTEKRTENINITGNEVPSRSKL